MNIDVKVKSALDKFAELYDKALIDASYAAIKSTANDVIKITLPNTLENTDKNKPATKQKGTFSKNIKRLKERIKNDVLSVAEAVPNKKGKPVQVKGSSFNGIYLIAKPKGKKRLKIKNKNLKTASTMQDILTFIKANSKLARKKVTYRTKTGKDVLWITKKTILNQAANELAKRAGNTLSGWTALAQKAGSGLLSSIKSQKVDNKGFAKITTKNGVISLDAINKEVDEPINSYQQRVVDASIPKSFKYHLENNIKHINVNKLKKQALES